MQPLELFRSKKESSMALFDWLKKKPAGADKPTFDFSNVSGGSSSVVVPPKAATPPPARTYTVVKGDSLSKIAKRELGDANKWRKIYEANRAVVGDNPDLIKPGQVLVIPS
jgi:nucleoid-associated protein YgaU